MDKFYEWNTDPIKKPVGSVDKFYWWKLHKLHSPKEASIQKEIEKVSSLFRMAANTLLEAWELPEEKLTTLRKELISENLKTLIAESIINLDIIKTDKNRIFWDDMLSNVKNSDWKTLSQILRDWDEEEVIEILWTFTQAEIMSLILSQNNIDPRNI